MELIQELWIHTGKIGKSILAVLGISILYMFFRSFILRKLETLVADTNNDLDDRLVYFLKQFLGLMTLFCTVILVLRINEIAISPLLAGAGIAGVAIGFAAKETLADILSGIFLIADRPLRIGDRVMLERIGRHWGTWGDVVDIGIRRTQIRNTDGVIVNYPNSVLASSIIKNFSFLKQPVRVRIRFQVGYEADIDLTRIIALKAIYSISDVVPDSADIVLRSIWDDDQGHLMAGYLLEGRYRIDDIRRRTVIRSAVLEQIVKALRDNDIPYASQPVTVQKD